MDEEVLCVWSGLHRVILEEDSGLAGLNATNRAFLETGVRVITENGISRVTLSDFSHPG